MDLTARVVNNDGPCSSKSLSSCGRLIAEQARWVEISLSAFHLQFALLLPRERAVAQRNQGSPLCSSRLQRTLRLRSSLGVSLSICAAVLPETLTSVPEIRRSIVVAG